MAHRFVPVDFNVPESISTDNFYLTILAPVVTELDYEAVMSSKKRLRTIFAENTKWPSDSMTQKDNSRDLLNHENEFKSRKAFAYSVLTPLQDKCIGCVYIDPCSFNEFDSEVYLWVRDDSTHLDNDLYEFVSHWMRTSWPFSNIAFPGRDISWEKWSTFEASA